MPLPIAPGSVPTAVEMKSIATVPTTMNANSCPPCPAIASASSGCSARATKYTGTMPTATESTVNASRVRYVVTMSHCARTSASTSRIAALRAEARRAGHELGERRRDARHAAHRDPLADEPRDERRRGVRAAGQRDARPRPPVALLRHREQVERRYAREHRRRPRRLEAHDDVVPVVREPLGEPPRGARRGHAPAVEHDDAIADVERRLRGVRREQHGAAAARDELV